MMSAADEELNPNFNLSRKIRSLQKMKINRLLSNEIAKLGWAITSEGYTEFLKILELQRQLFATIATVWEPKFGGH